MKPIHVVISRIDMFNAK